MNLEKDDRNENSSLNQRLIHKTILCSNTSMGVLINSRITRFFSIKHKFFKIPVREICLKVRQTSRFVFAKNTVFVVQICIVVGDVVPLLYDLKHETKNLHPEGSKPHPRERFLCPKPIAKNNLIEMANYSQQQADSVTNHNDREVLNLVQGQNHDFGCQFQYVKNQNETDLLKIEEQAAFLV